MKREPRPMPGAGAGVVVEPEGGPGLAGTVTGADADGAVVGLRVDDLLVVEGGDGV